MNRSKSFMILLIVISFTVVACDESEFEFNDPARGPGEYVGNGDRVSNAEFRGGNDALPESNPFTPVLDGQAPDCGPICEAYCETLKLENPVNRGMCNSGWGVGLMHQPVVRSESCRRIFVDMIGRFPTRDDMVDTCDGKTYGEVVTNLMSRDEFIKVNQRRWADKLLYDTQAVSIERIYDMDKLVGKLYQGKVSYDAFASVVSAHPILTRRHDTPEDRAEALFWLFTGRPPLGYERSDMAKLYNLWHNGYYDHPELQMRLPDSHVRFRCLSDDGTPNNATRADCTSVLWGTNELIFESDIRAQQQEGTREETIWSGMLTTEEWERLQLPGRLISQQTVFWEAMVDDILLQYLGYDLGTQIPAVRDELVRYAIEFNGDIRAVHFAVATSAAYLQSANGDTQSQFRWTFGPNKQIDSEAWLDTIKNATGYELGTCDHRLTRPQDFLEEYSIGSIALLENSTWMFEGENIDFSYRDAARGLGGCPDNSNGGRFKIVSILTTAQQLNMVNRVCDTGLEGDGVDIRRILPSTVEAGDRATADVAAEIMEHQVNMFYSRRASNAELEDARIAAGECDGCSAREFARPTCFAVLSSSEMMFY